MVKKIAIATLVEDFSLYPRNRVDEAHVSDLVRAVQSGATLPPLVACAKTLRLVDGVHRRRCLLKAFGPEAVFDVDLRKYKSDADLFLEAVELNSHHGRKLDRHDQTRIVLRLRELEVDDKTIALSLHIPEPTIQTLSLRIVTDEAGATHPAKRGLSHMYGHQMTAGQMQAMGSVRSAEAGRLCMELTRLLENDLVDLTDDQTVSRLRQLEKAIESALHAVAA